MRKLKKKSRKIIIIAGICLFVFLCSIVFFCVRNNESRLLISLKYENATMGLYPDGSYFSPHDILSEELIQSVAEKESVDINKLTKSLGITYEGSNDIILTDITIVCEGFNKKKREAILNSIGELYEKQMEETFDYKDATETLSTSSVDVLDTLENLLTKGNRILRYLKEIKQTDSDLYAKLNHMVNVELPALKNLVIESGYSNTPKPTASLLAYRNLLLQKQKRESDGQYNNRLKSIQLYDATLFPTISVPSVNNGEYYISTTKTGLDYIYLDSEFFLNQSLQLEESTINNEYIKKHLTENESDAEVEVSAQIVEEMDTLIAEFRKMLQEENLVTHPYITYQVEGGAK